MWQLVVKASLRLCAVLAVLLGLHHLYARQIIEFLLPLLRIELLWLDDSFRILYLGITNNPRGGTDTMIKLDVTLAKHVYVGTQLLAPNAGIKEMASTVTGTALRPLIVGISMLWVCPAKNHWAYLQRTLIGIPLLLMILPFDVPLMLLGQLYEILQFLAKTKEGFEYVIGWKVFLQGGGPIALALVAATVTISIVDHFSAHQEARK